MEFFEIIKGFRKTLRLIGKQEKLFLLIASFLMLINGILTNLPALFLGRLVDKLIGLKSMQFNLAIPFILLIILVILIREVLTVIRKYLVENIATQTEKKQTVAVIDHLLKADISVINDQQIGSIHGKIFRSVQGLVRMIKLGFLDFFPVFFSALAALAIAFYQKPFLAVFMVLVIPTGLFIIIKQVSSQKGIRIALLRGKEKIDGTVVEILGGLETVRVDNTTSYEVKKVEEVAEDLRKKEIKHHIFMALFDSGKYLNEGFFYILVISLSILFSAQGVISRGDILVYSILFLSITGPLREIHRILDEAHESTIRINDLYQILEEPLDESFKYQAKPDKLFNLDPENIIEVKNLSFIYSDRQDVILDHINFAIKKGEKIGIVGASGSGKTTLIKILLRLVHKYSGEIYLLGKNLKDLDRTEIAEKIAYVPQKTYIFSGTISENITYGCLRKNISHEEIIEASRKAHIYGEIIHSLGGFNGRVSENGNNLSGGQKQRIAIARLILKFPELFIFDEATSALDNTNEALVQKNIENLFKDKTIITIAHRLTTLKKSDRILVFNKGKIVQEGKYNELADKKGLFQDFLKQRIEEE